MTKATLKKWFKFIGYDFDKSGILKLQKKYFKRKQDQDGICGNDTTILATHVHHVKLYAPSFKPEDFRCPCGKCTGYPTYMRVNELKHIQSIVEHYGLPMTVTCGLRCENYNKQVGGIANSAHLKGKAVDFYIKGVTDTTENRRRSIKWIKKQPHHKYTYGDKASSDGENDSYPNMANALHTEVK